MPSVWIHPGHQLEHGEIGSAAEATRRYYASVNAILSGLKPADPGITTEHRGLKEAQSRPADLFTTAAFPGRSAALDLCVASSNAAAARGDAAHAAFESNLHHYRHEMLELSAQGILHRLLVWTADGRPHPAVTRTLQHAADIASCRNGQHMSAEAVQHRWKHQIQIALLWRRAAMSRAVLPSPHISERAMASGWTHGQSHWPLVRAPPARWRRR